MKRCLLQTTKQWRYLLFHERIETANENILVSYFLHIMLLRVSNFSIVRLSWKNKNNSSENIRIRRVICWRFEPRILSWWPDQENESTIQNKYSKMEKISFISKKWVFFLQKNYCSKEKEKRKGDLSSTNLGAFIFSFQKRLSVNFCGVDERLSWINFFQSSFSRLPLMGARRNIFSES